MKSLDTSELGLRHCRQAQSRAEGTGCKFLVVQTTLCLKKSDCYVYNFTISQHLLIIFGRERPYSVLN